MSALATTFYRYSEMETQETKTEEELPTDLLTAVVNLRVFSCPDCGLEFRLVNDFAEHVDFSMHGNGRRMKSVK